MIKIPAKVLNLTLSKKDFKPGEELYGEAEVITDPYFQSNSFEFKRGFIKKQAYFKYVFKVKL